MFSLFRVVALPIRKQNPSASCAVLNVGACSTDQAIFAKWNEFIKKHGFDWMKYKSVEANGTAAMQRTTNGVVREIKIVSLDCVSTCLFGDFSVTDRSFFLNYRK